MISSALCFLGGIIILHQLAVLPDLLWLIVSASMLPLAYSRRKLHIFFWLLAGFIWAWCMALFYYHHEFPESLQGRDLNVSGEVISVADKMGRKSRFIFKINAIEDKYQSQWKNPGVVRMSWYGNTQDIMPGQIWQLTVRLKRPHGFSNPAGFDYEGWLFQQGIHASGYVRTAASNRLLETTWNPQSIRHHILQQLQQSLQAADNKGMIIALALGMRGDISQEQWNDLQRTGTGHLIAISGLHIGLVAGLCFFLAQFFWRLWPRLCLCLPAPKAAAIIALCGASVYAFLAGLAIPTQRALAMIFVVMLAVLLDRTHKPSHVLSLALLFVLLLDPAAVLAAGFWLSFAAVSILLYGMSGRYQVIRGWKSWGRAQWLVSIGLVPLGLFLFQKTSLISPLANLIAIPWVSFLIVPLVLSGTLALSIYKPVGEFLLQLCDALLSPLQALMTNLAGLSYAQWIQHSPPVWVMITAAIAIVLLLAPAGIPVKRMGILLLLPVFTAGPARVPYAGVRLTVLDVGQGLATVIETQQHVLVYDTGPKFSERFDTGDSVVLPYLYQRDIKQVDTMVISHGDNDHRGGFESVQKNIGIRKLYSGTPEKLIQFSPLACQQSIQWQWDGVRFTFLHPDKLESFKKNDRSCVLKIESPGGSILLTGDIHKKSERHLLTEQASRLKSDILIAPHHGSKTSSHTDFIQAVSATYVIFTAGFHNRFHHPNAKVVQRYQQSGARLLDSATHGAIEFDIDSQSGISAPQTYRQLLSRHWKRNALREPKNDDYWTFY